MESLLEITGEHIAKLSDSQLRELIGLLCEADFRKEELSCKGIFWGGSQDAADGGLDVVVKNKFNPPKNSFVPRKFTGFQVKKPKMSKSSILSEMSSKGSLRDVIKTLINKNGAYLIISSGDSLTHLTLQNRLKAMRDMTLSEDKDSKLFIDFYDRGRVASWVREHPSYIIWVHNKIGLPMSGWRPFENWCNSPDGVMDEYLIDESSRFFSGIDKKNEGVSIEEGITELRTLLSKTRSSIRLTGLSGVGKTRFAQALFDARIGKQALNPSNVIYTDISDSPKPDPVSLAEQLLTTSRKATIIVDNCPPDLHRRLTKVCSKSKSKLSLLTIEYDVRDDMPEETDVFRLEPSGLEIIKILIKRRFEFISDLDARMIADFSGGNSRVALALGNTLNKGESISGLRDEELFNRLFSQRNDKSETLLRCAEVCSLVYSFEGTEIDNPKSELGILASLIEVSPSELFRNVAILKERDLIQSRSIWRALLPHAISNRLANRALLTIPTDVISRVFKKSPERMIISFTRRLSYLHENENAFTIAKDWLAADGWVGSSIGNFNRTGLTLFKNLSSVDPESTLNRLVEAATNINGKKFTSRENKHHVEFVRILNFISYDPQFFNESVEVIIRFALSENEKENVDSTRNVLEVLFQLYLSGTHASPQQRAKIIRDLLASSEVDRRNLGVLLLESTLKTWHFSGGIIQSFGARSRDYGYQPKSKSEIVIWYETFVGICFDFANINSPLANKVRQVLANNIRGLITQVRILDEIDDRIREMHLKDSWNQGWLALKEIKRYDSKELGKETIDKIKSLVDFLKPNNLINKVKVFALNNQHLGRFDITDDYSEKEDYETYHKLIDRITFDLGTKVALDTEGFKRLLPDLVSTNAPRLYQFGQGLAFGIKNKTVMWKCLIEQCDRTEKSIRQYNVMLGFMNQLAEVDKGLYNQFLDDILLPEHCLRPWFPLFQCVSKLDPTGLKRIKKSLDGEYTLLWTYMRIDSGINQGSLSSKNFVQVIRKLRKKIGGSSVVADLLYYKFESKKSKRFRNNEIISEAYDFLSHYPFEEDVRTHSHLDYALTKIASVCLQVQYGFTNSKSVCENAYRSIEDNHLYPSNYRKYFQCLAELQPNVFLDTFIGEQPSENYRHRLIFRNNFERHDAPLRKISNKTILSWCEQNPQYRYPRIIEVIDCFGQNKEGKLDWKRLVYQILRKAPDKVAILKEMKHSLSQTMMSSSLVNVLEKRKLLLANLQQHPLKMVSNWAISEYPIFLNEIERHREWEAERSTRVNESFE